jgi:hypothetical protein
MMDGYGKAVLCDAGSTLSFSCSERELLDGLMDYYRRNPRNRVEEWSVEIEGRRIHGFTVECHNGWFGDGRHGGYIECFLQENGWLLYSETATPQSPTNGSAFHTHKSYFKRRFASDVM